MDTTKTTGGSPTSSFHITTYSPSHAAGLATMWNLSADSWGGSGTVYTAATIEEEHAVSTNLEEFLAIDEASGEVIGFCSFSRYARDEGALYIPLLNVRPDWHGKKVGKALVLQAVKKTIEMGWPRLDLYTWPGNTKAVPTYKKCGFFWERRDDTTHLMNFMPTILNTDLLEPFFRTADWYETSIRKILVEPDGREENGFHFYEYRWEHEGRMLRVEFERTGRGMRAIETDDWMVEMTLESHANVSGRERQARFRFVNKTGTPMQVSLEGQNDGLVHFNGSESFAVHDRTECFLPYMVNEAPEPQNRMKTHPAVMAHIMINGLSATLRTGVESKPPLHLSIQMPPGEAFPGTDAPSWLALENGFDEPVTFSLSLPGSGVMFPLQPDIHCQLGPAEKRSIPCPHHILTTGFHDVTVNGTAPTKRGESMSFTARVTHLAKGWQGWHSGEDDSGWFISCGRFSWHLSKDGGSGRVLEFEHDESATWFQCPSIGKPWSSEFNTQRPEDVQQEREGDAMVQRAWFVSRDFPGVTVCAVVKLMPGGELHRRLEVTCKEDAHLPQPLYVGDSVRHDFARATLPYDGTFIHLADEDEEMPSWYEFNRLTENWVFSRGDRFTRGLWWAPSLRGAFANGMAFEHEIVLPQPGECYVTPPLILCCGMFENWQDFRAHVRKEHATPRPKSEGTVAVLINEGNPILSHKSSPDLSREFNVRVREHKLATLGESVTAQCDDRHDKPIKGTSADNGTSVTLSLEAPKDKPHTTVSVQLDRPEAKFTSRRQLFLAGSHPVRQEETTTGGSHVLTASNGTLDISISPAFSHALFSLKFNGREWLDTAFPTPEPRSWWNSWPGGLAAKPWEVQHATAHQAGRSGNWCSRTDNLGNHWQGVSTHLTLGDHPKFKGLSLQAEWLMLPGLPLLAHIVQIHNGTGRYLNREELGLECFLCPGGILQECWLETDDETGENRRYHAGKVHHEIRAQGRLIVGSDNQPGLLQFHADNGVSDMIGFANVAALATMYTWFMTLPPDASSVTTPVFLLFTDKAIPDGELADLNNIRFNNEA